MKERKLKGLRFAETGYVLDDKQRVAVKLIKRDTINKITIFASARIVDENGETLVQIEPCSYGMPKAGLTKEILRETVETATQEQIERVLREKEVLELLNDIPGETDD